MDRNRDLLPETFPVKDVAVKGRCVQPWKFHSLVVRGRKSRRRVMRFRTCSQQLFNFKRTIEETSFECRVQSKELIAFPDAR